MSHLKWSIFFFTPKNYTFLPTCSPRANLNEIFLLEGKNRKLQPFFTHEPTESCLHLFGVERGLPGGCLGVPRDTSLGTPRQPPGNPLWNPFDQRMGCIHIQKMLLRAGLQKMKQNQERFGVRVSNGFHAIANPPDNGGLWKDQNRMSVCEKQDTHLFHELGWDDLLILLKLQMS